MNSTAQTINRSGVYKFGFWSTLLCWIIAVPLSVLSIVAARLAVALWVWLNGPDVANLLSPEYWLFGIEAERSFLDQMFVDSMVAFFNDFVCYAAGLLFTFWCFIKLRRKIGWKISVTSVVMFLCVTYIALGLGSLAINAFYSWKVYELGLLGCEMFSAEFYKCNYVLLDIPRVSAAAANIMAAVFAGQVFGRHLDDTDAWVEELTQRIERRMNFYMPTER